MPTTKGPLLSAQAAGQVADVLTFAKGKRGTYAKTNTPPAQPRTSKQLNARAIVAFLAEQWRLLSSAEQATWSARAAAAKLAPYHAFVAYNCNRWATVRTPTKEDPAAESSTPPKRGGGLIAAKVKSILLSINYEFPYPDWGYVISRSTATFPQNTPGLAVAFVVTNPLPRTDWLDTPLETGTYYYRFEPFNADGVSNGQAGLFSATVA